MYYNLLRVLLFAVCYLYYHLLRLLLLTACAYYLLRVPLFSACTINCLHYYLLRTTHYAHRLPPQCASMPAFLLCAHLRLQRLITLDDESYAVSKPL